MPSSLHAFSDPARQAAFQRGIALFNRREFFECHEAWEEVWTPARGPERLFLQALIHFAVGFYHHQRKNQEGAARQLRKGLKKLEPYLPQFLGIDTRRLYGQVSRRLEAIAGGGKVKVYPKISIQPPGAAADPRHLFRTR
jgi:predicted metal-dependent hydrolase